MFKDAMTILVSAPPVLDGNLTEQERALIRLVRQIEYGEIRVKKEGHVIVSTKVEQSVKL